MWIFPEEYTNICGAVASSRKILSLTRETLKNPWKKYCQYCGTADYSLFCASSHRAGL